MTRTELLWDEIASLFIPRYSWNTRHQLLLSEINEIIYPSTYEYEF